jgi:hypothetical protein
MTAVHHLPWVEIACWHLTECSSDFNILNHQLAWLNQQPGGQYYSTYVGKIWFERAEDCALFVLSWS